MIVMAALAVLRVYPPGVILAPGNCVVAVAMLVGAVVVGLWRPGAYPLAMGCAGLTAVCGVLATLKVRGFQPPEFPLVWVVIALYIAFRLTLIRNKEREPTPPRARLRPDAEPPAPDAAPPASDGGSAAGG